MKKVLDLNAKIDVKPSGKFFVTVPLPDKKIKITSPDFDELDQARAWVKFTLPRELEKLMGPPS